MGWLPLGGYCQIDGMVDESLVTEGLESDPKPWEFRSKPVWQRFLVMIGGVLFNVILAVLIYGCIAYTWGTSKLPMEQTADHMRYSEVGHLMGLEDGDRIYALDGDEVEYFDASLTYKAANSSRLTVIRDGQKVNIKVPSDLMRAIIK